MTQTVLIVDDEPMTRELLRMMLEPAGYTIIEAEDGVGALEKVKECQPDLILLDVMMPEMDGIVVCQRLREETETAHLPIIMLSAKTVFGAVEEGLKAGADQYLTKPVSRKALLECINKLLNVGTPGAHNR